MPLKVVSIISRMNIGGPALLLSELVNLLPRDQFQHVLVTGVCQENEIDFLDSHPIDSEVIYINDIRRSLLPLADLKALLTLIKVLRKIDPDLIHTHTSKAGVLGRVAARIAVPKAKVVHTYHGHLLYGYFSKGKIRLIVSLERFLGKITDVYVAVTEQVKVDLYQTGIGPIGKWRVIYPGVNSKTSISQEVSKESLGVPKEMSVVSWIGRFTEIKNPMLAIQAFESIDGKNNLHLLMAGAGELLEECKAYANNRNLSISFLGWVTDINPILAASDLLLMTSRNEGMPVVIVEAALKGIPTITTNVGGVSEFVKDGETGWLVDQSIHHISNRIEYLIDNFQLIKLVGSKAKILAESDFSVGKFVSGHVKLYKDLLN